MPASLPSFPLDRYRRCLIPLIIAADLFRAGHMQSKSFDFLKRLLNTPAPSGFETPAARVWREEAKGFADRVTSDVLGNSVAVIDGKGGTRIMLAGHIDEIGVMITHIDDDG